MKSCEPFFYSAKVEALRICKYDKHEVTFDTVAFLLLARILRSDSARRRTFSTESFRLIAYDKAFFSLACSHTDFA